MAGITFECVKCSKKFGPGEWECFPGEEHVVAEKTYYVPNSCADVADRNKSILNVVVEGEREWTDGNGQKQMSPARFIKFTKGIFTTTNPKDQFFMESKYKPNLIDSATWERMYITKEDQMAMKERSLAAREKEVERRDNELLARVKEQKGR